MSRVGESEAISHSCLCDRAERSVCGLRTKKGKEEKKSGSMSRFSIFFAKVSAIIRQKHHQLLQKPELRFQKSFPVQRLQQLRFRTGHQPSFQKWKAYLP